MSGVWLQAYWSWCFPSLSVNVPASLPSPLPASPQQPPPPLPSPSRQMYRHLVLTSQSWSSCSMPIFHSSTPLHSFQMSSPLRLLVSLLLKPCFTPTSLKTFRTLVGNACLISSIFQILVAHIYDNPLHMIMNLQPGLSEIDRGAAHDKPVSPWLDVTAQCGADGGDDIRSTTAAEADVQCPRSQFALPLTLFYGRCD